MSKPLKILFDANSLMGRRTGVGYYTGQLIEALAREHPEVSFTGYFYNFLGRKPTPTHPAAPNIRYRPIYHFPGPIINLLRRFRIEVPVELLTFVHADFILYPNFLNQPSLFRTPSAMVIHDLTFVDLPDYVARKNLSDLQRFIPSHLQRSRFVIIVSEFGKKRLHDVFHTPLSDILVTPIPPEVPLLQDEVVRTAALKNLGVTGKYFLLLNTIEPRKNILGMIDAFLLLPEALQREYTFVLTGKIGWNCETEVARLQQMKSEGKNVLHLGYVTTEERAALYQSSTFFTSASHYEGFGMTPLEAMSYGKACALSDIEVFHEVAGDAALYFDQRDPASIAKAWGKMLTNQPLRKKLAAASKKRADSYNWDEVANGLYDRIVRTLEEKKP